MSEQLHDNWEEDGECADLPLDQVDEIFFPDKYNGYVNPAAVEMCGRCVVKAECLEDALENPPTHGIRAGIAAIDLRKMANGQNVLQFKREDEDI